MPIIPDYNLKEPTEHDALASLQRVFGPQQAQTRWAQACVEALRTPGMVRPGADLARVSDALATQGGPAATVARAIEIRMRTYYRLLERTLPRAVQASQ